MRACLFIFFFAETTFKQVQYISRKAAVGNYGRGNDDDTSDARHTGAKSNNIPTPTQYIYMNYSNLMVER